MCGFSILSFISVAGITGTGFIAKDMTIQNTAGIEGQQAVALRVSADQTAFQGLSIEGYQVCLHSNSNTKGHEL